MDSHLQFAHFFQHPVLQPLACLLSQKLSEGHICMALSELPGAVELVPEDWQSRLEGATADSIAKLPMVGSAQDLQRPFILHEDRLYLQRYFKYETDTLVAIQKLIAGEEPLLAGRLAKLEAHREQLLPLFAGGGKPGSTDWQSAAVINSALQNFAIITGGPGTGKTTTIARLLALLFTVQPGLRVALTAPTGKAATRMAESLRNTVLPGFENLKDRFESLSPTTIHRLLKAKRETPYFHHNGGNPVPFDVVIVDECSMVDVALFAKLLCAIGPHTRLFLLGDKAQLASVEAGSIFGDLCNAQARLNLFSPVRRALLNSFIADSSQHLSINAEDPAGSHELFGHVVELQTSYRFTQDAGIGRLSRSVIAGDAAAVATFLTGPEDAEVTIDTEYEDSLFEAFVAGYSNYICEPDIATALKQFAQLRVLCAQREGPAGLYATNKAIEEFLRGRRLLSGYDVFYNNRPLIVTKNYYNYGLFNGDTGIIRPNAEGTLMAWFEKSDGTLHSILPGYLTDIETAFALTVHKSQGSEFESVLLLLPNDTESPLLTRELLYTAITRAKSQMLIQGTAEVLEAMTGRGVQRASGLSTRFGA